MTRVLPVSPHLLFLVTRVLPVSHVSPCPSHVTRVSLCPAQPHPHQQGGGAWPEGVWRHGWKPIREGVGLIEGAGLMWVGLIEEMGLMGRGL